MSSGAIARLFSVLLEDELIAGLEELGNHLSVQWEANVFRQLFLLEGTHIAGIVSGNHFTMDMSGQIKENNHIDAAPRGVGS